MACAGPVVWTPTYWIAHISCIHTVLSDGVASTFGERERAADVPQTVPQKGSARSTECRVHAQRAKQLLRELGGGRKREPRDRAARTRWISRVAPFARASSRPPCSRPPCCAMRCLFAGPHFAPHHLVHSSHAASRRLIAIGSGLVVLT